MAIPRTLHQIWIGDSMPAQHRDWCGKLSRMNPDWDYQLWGNELLDRYETDPYVIWMRHTNERTAFLVDRLRVLLLRDSGGVYLDVDCMPRRPLSQLDSVWDNPAVDFAAGLRSPDRRYVSLNTPGVSLIDNTFLASAPGSPMIKRLCDLYRPDARRHTGFSMGREIMRHLGPSSCLLNYRYFYAEQDNPDCIVLHDSVNLGSWLRPNEAAKS